jgi:CMP-N,N'-diacetyllegionaminic acid synthase
MTRKKNKVRTLAIIPCRSGSKGIKNKNIKKIFKKHLIYYSIKFAQNCNFIDKVIISTDSKKYQSIGKAYGLYTSFLRPKKISGDFSLDIDFVRHSLKMLKKENFVPEFIILLRPTSPIRKIKELKQCLNILKKNKKFSSIRSITRINKSLYKTWYYQSGNKINPVLKNDTNLLYPYDSPRQKLKNFYIHNGVYDIFRYSLLKKNTISGSNIYGYEMKEFTDLDDPKDIKFNKKNSYFLKNFSRLIKS